MHQIRACIAHQMKLVHVLKEILSFNIEYKKSNKLRAHCQSMGLIKETYRQAQCCQCYMCYISQNH